MYVHHQRGEHAIGGPRIRQFLKVLEQLSYYEGDWEFPWLISGLPDPRPKRRVGGGLLHPSEFAANVAHIKETAALETVLAQRRQGWKPHVPPKVPPNDPPPKGPKGGGKDKKGKDKDKGKTIQEEGPG